MTKAHAMQRDLRLSRALGLLLTTATAALVSACAATDGVETAPAPVAEIVLPVFDADDALTRKWRHVKVWGDSDWRLVALGDDIVIEPDVDGSSTALARYIDIDTEICPIAEWSWRVDALPDGADLASRKSEDVAASIFFAFGDPGTFSNPDPVPTLRYVWSTETNPVGEIVASPYFPASLKSVVVRSGPDGLGDWQSERRDLRADFEAAFGEAPPEPVRIVALFTDNDHLELPAKAFYANARALCTEEPDSFWSG